MRMMTRLKGEQGKVLMVDRVLAGTDVNSRLGVAWDATGDTGTVQVMTYETTYGVRRM